MLQLSRQETETLVSNAISSFFGHSESIMSDDIIFLVNSKPLCDVLGYSLLEAKLINPIEGYDAIESKYMVLAVKEIQKDNVALSVIIRRDFLMVSVKYRKKEIQEIIMDLCDKADYYQKLITTKIYEKTY